MEIAITVDDNEKRSLFKISRYRLFSKKGGKFKLAQETLSRLAHFAKRRIFHLDIGFRILEMINLFELCISGNNYT